MTAVVPRPAATVVLVRPGGDGLEVLLTRRPDTMAFAPGLHVFPGGRVDPADTDPRLIARSRLSIEQAAARLDWPADRPPIEALAHHVAALRELVEEVGVLLVEPAADPGVAHAARAALAAGELEFARFIDEAGLTLATDRLIPIARWTTPRTYPRRFAARFFVAELPAGAELDIDPREVAAHRWLSPRAALRAMAAGEIALWPPTSTTLQRLERAETIDDVRTKLVLGPEPPMTVERLAGGVVRLTGRTVLGPTGTPANAYLVGLERVVVVDPGDPGAAFLDALEAEVAAGGGRIVGILLSHVDPGHASGSEELRARTGAPITCGPGGGASLCWMVDEVGDGAVVTAGDRPIRLLATPGHRPDHLAFRLDDGSVLTGDALGSQPTLVLGPEGDPAAQRETLLRFRELGMPRILPGHGPVLEGAAVAEAIERELRASASSG